MKITFIRPYYMNHWEALGIANIASYIKKYYYGDLDLSFFDEFFDPTLNIIDDAVKSDIVAFSCTTPTYNRGLMFANLIKKTNPKVKIVFGGWHVTCDENLDLSYIDQIVFGEGEGSFLDILQGETSKEVGTIMCEFEKNLWPDRELINQRRQLDYCEKEFGVRIASFQSRKGCPMSCRMCSEKWMSYNWVRVRDSEDTLDEIEYVNKTYGIEKFKFIDPTWCYPKYAATEFCEAKIRRNNTIPWEAMAHVSFLTKDIMKLLKESNCMQINVGVESGDQRILNEIRKGTTINQIKRVFEWGKEIGLDMRGFYILGMPSEDNVSIENTKEIIRQTNPSVVGVTIFCPYPGTDDYDSISDKVIDWEKADEYSNDFWRTEIFTNEELKKIQREFAEEFNEKLPPHMKEVLDIE
uniref:Putative vitamin B12-binding domain containing protein n=1 Tax=viral metagenome TaxID=1070528 RepID=A0A6M3XHP2_9ZZZZ